MDTLRSIWNDDSLHDPGDRRFVSQWFPRMKRFRQKIWLRDSIEIGAAVFTIIVFTVYLIAAHTITARIGCAIVILSLLFIIGTFIRNRVQQIDAGAPIKEACYGYKKEMERQISLLKNILFWYLLPLSLGLIVFVLGLALSPPSLAISISVILLVNGIIFWTNKRALKRELLPQYKALCNLLADLGE